MSKIVIFEDQASGYEKTFPFRSKVSLLWVRTGAAVIEHDGAIVLVLEVGDRMVLDGHPPGTTVTGRATADNTTLVVSE